MTAQRQIHRLRAALLTHRPAPALTDGVRPGGPALDLTGDRIRELAAENARLRTALRETQRDLDDALDRESMHVGAACMEHLTTAASIARLGQARARHISPAPAATAAGQLGATGVFA